MKRHVPDKRSRQRKGKRRKEKNVEKKERDAHKYKDRQAGKIIRALFVNRGRYMTSIAVSILCKSGKEAPQVWKSRYGGYLRLCEASV